ncbi:twin-arginine translocation signal domain-containing protein, partial [Natronococcus sp.]|uniref:twin-arginine translocation signal domain-containing protein n=1 Tax=Natronococcus sp. TaxID=35747 RepID=UPI003A4E5DF2
MRLGIRDVNYMGANNTGRVSRRSVHKAGAAGGALLGLPVGQVVGGSENNDA